jgi:ketosteroid isomerase-like protein
MRRAANGSGERSNVDTLVTEAQEFLASTMPRYLQAERAIHDGDAGPRAAMWSRREPVTLFGAAVTEQGWADVAPVFDWLASSFSDCLSYRNEVIAAEVSGDLAYLLALEHTEASIDGEPHAYTLRVTTIFRREDGEWKIVHRHGDSIGPQARTDLARSVSAGTRRA